MKQFLILSVCLPIMLLFIAQFSLEQINSIKVSLITELVCTAKEEAKEEGCFSSDIKKRLSENISKRTGIDEDAIEIEADSSVKYRITEGESLSGDDYKRGLIHYRVRVPIGFIMAGAGLLGIKEEDNIYYYVIDSYTASEKLP